MKSLFGIAAAAALLVTAAAHANSMTSFVNFSWDEMDTGLVLTDTIVIPEGVASIDSITVSIAHSWASDLDITVNNFDNFDLMFNEGSDTDLGDGLGVALENALDYTFVPVGTPGAFTDFGFSDPNSAGMYEANFWNDEPFAAGTSFTLAIADFVVGDPGSISEWRINYTPTPAPGALALLGLAGLVVVRRRRG